MSNEKGKQPVPSLVGKPSEIGLVSKVSHALPHDDPRSTATKTDAGDDVQNDDQDRVKGDADPGITTSQSPPDPSPASSPDPDHGSEVEHNKVTMVPPLGVKSVGITRDDGTFIQYRRDEEGLFDVDALDVETLYRDGFTRL